MTFHDENCTRRPLQDFGGLVLDDFVKSDEGKE
jgi:hypothetical protein